jgi:ATP-binding cassette subfamily F protein 3
VDLDTLTSTLSGGWKKRLAITEALVQHPDILLLDEPTNHLDIRSREILLNALKNFAGTVVIVSHDRHFLRSLVGRVFEIDHGEMRVYEGTYEYYLGKTLDAE